MTIESFVIQSVFDRLEDRKNVVIPRTTSIYNKIQCLAESNYKVFVVDMRCSGRVIRLTPIGDIVRKQKREAVKLPFF
jgi:hypothetical protein